MAWVDIVALLAVAQLSWFGILVGGARGRTKVLAPAITGHPEFERYFRVQMNTLELIPALLVGLYMAAKYWSPAWAAGLGAVYLVGRFVYLAAYVKDPAKRSAGFGLSFLPIAVLVVGALVGAVRGLLHG
jgi:glutathione S-transferase